MGAKIWILVASSSSPSERLGRIPSPDREASAALVARLFPSRRLLALADGDLSQTCPRDGEIVAGRFGDLSIVAAEEFGIDHPSRLPRELVDAFPGQRVQFVCMHSVVDWCAFALWEDGRLVRSLSLSPDTGILENIGTPLPFEKPFWETAAPEDGDAPEDSEPDEFPFHPLELGDAALQEFLGFQIEGDQGLYDPSEIALLRFGLAKPWWKFW